MSVNRATKACIWLCALAYPIAYIISDVLGFFLNLLRIFIPSDFLPVVDRNVTVILLYLSVNIVVLLRLWDAKNRSKKTQNGTAAG